MAAAPQVGCRMISQRGNLCLRLAAAEPSRPARIRRCSAIGLQACAFVLFASGLHATTFYVTVAGLGGEPDYEQRFSGWAKDIDKALKSAPDAKIETLYGPAATRAAIHTALDRISKEAKPQDAVVVMLIGHGTYDGADYKINL